jgi:transcriptional regulator with XRE-family HTH domain
MSAGENFDAAAFAKRMKHYRVLRDMTLQDVADAAGITKSHVWELEQGRSTNPSVSAIWGIARALSISPATLLGMNTDVPPLHPTALKIAGIVDRELRAAKPAKGKAR